MALIKWGEIKTKRGYIGAVIGAVIGVVLGYLSVNSSGELTTQIIGLVVGFVVGCLLGHGFDPKKTIVYKYKDEDKKEA